MRWSRTITNINLFTTLCALSTAAVIPRYLQNAVYDSAHDRVLFIGGTTSDSNVTKDVYALDLSAAFNRSNVNLTAMPSLSNAVSDAAAVIDTTGQIYLLGGQQEACSTALTVQTLSSNGSSWKTAISTGATPGPRSGAGATIIGSDIFYFGGKSLVGCKTGQYYYNGLYQVDIDSLNWTAVGSTNPPVAEASMTLTNLNDGSFILVGGESVSSNSRASWVGMTQFAHFSSNASSWSYLSTADSVATVNSRSGHTAAYNGSHTFVYGGAVGSISSTPNFLSIGDVDSSLNITSIEPANPASGPPVSLYGHSAVMTKNGIMVIAFGLQGSSNSTTFNDGVYLYDTVLNKWLDSYDPKAHPEVHNTIKSSSLSTGTIVAAALVPVVFVALAAIMALSMCKRRRQRRRRLSAFPVNRLGTFSPSDTDEHDFEEKLQRPLDADGQVTEVHLPPWAAMHACQARSKSPPPAIPEKASGIDQIMSEPNRPQMDYDVQDVQFACPPSPRVMTFTAPRLQLRVVNPDHVSTRNSLDVVRGMPELVTTSQSGLTTTLPITITNEDDLELLRSRLSDSPMIGNIDDQLAGLGLVIREDMIHEPGTGKVRRVRTISRQRSRVSMRSRSTKRPAYRDQTPPRLSVISNVNTSLDLDSMLSIGLNISPVVPSGFSSYSPEFSSYSPYLDSPRDSVASSPVQTSRTPKSPTDAHRTASRSPQLPATLAASRAPDRVAIERQSSWASNSSTVALLKPWPSTKAKDRVH